MTKPVSEDRVVVDYLLRGFDETRNHYNLSKERLRTILAAYGISTDVAAVEDSPKETTKVKTPFKRDKTQTVMADSRFKPIRWESEDGAQGCILKHVAGWEGSNADPSHLDIFLGGGHILTLNEEEALEFLKLFRKYSRD